MTYQKDGSPFRIAPGKVIPNILYYGWLSEFVPYEKVVDKQDFRLFQKLADSVNHQMTRGYHSCEFCDWENADYGNGEMWVRIKDTTYVFPRMIWHYMDRHDYGIPSKIYSSIKSNDHEVMTEEQIEDVLDVGVTAFIEVPYLRRRAIWRTTRYENMGDFFNRNNQTWRFNGALIEDGNYVVEINALPPQMEILFEADPENFPDQVLITSDKS
jgi:hypothetical protein